MSRDLSWLNAHNFPKQLDTHGGQAFRDWCMLYRHKDVFVGFRNYNFIALVSSTPGAEWHRGCNDSCCNGNPMPFSEGSQLMRIRDLPAEIQPLADALVDEALEVVREKIIENAKIEADAIEDKMALEKLREKAIIEAWKKAYK